MIEKGMYFGKNEIYEKIRQIGGSWNDSKERPIVCLIKSTEHDKLYWAIPVGKWDHRDSKAKARINNYLAKDKDNIEHNYYHVGKTTVKSIFFISDVIPITDKYIERTYKGFNNEIFIIKNKKLLKELEDKLKRILTYENSRPNYFRQHITDLKNLLISELNETETLSPKNITYTNSNEKIK